MVLNEFSTKLELTIWSCLLDLVNGFALVDPFCKHINRLMERVNPHLEVREAYATLEHADLISTIHLDLDRVRV